MNCSRSSAPRWKVYARVAAIGLLVAALTACGASLAGQTYGGDMGTLRFEDSNDVTWSLGGVLPVTGTYSASQTDVRVELVNGDVMTLQRHGATLATPQFTLVRQ